MIRGVEPHVARAGRCLHGLLDVVLVRRILVDDRKSAIGVRSEDVACHGIVARAIDTGADRQGREARRRVVRLWAASGELVYHGGPEEGLDERCGLSAGGELYVP